jgi:hypothetical protein
MSITTSPAHAKLQRAPSPSGSQRPLAFPQIRNQPRQVDMSGYDRNARAALLLQDCDLTNRDCALILGLFALVIGAVVGVVIAVLA